jgi:hypothetical protein
MKQMTPPTSPPRRRKRFRKARGLRVTDKKNLTPADIPVVADLLISLDAISYFLYHCRSIYEKLVTFSVQQPQGSNNNIETSIVTALDTMQDLLKGNRFYRLLLRFTYVQLIWSINAYKAVATTDCVERKVSWNVGYREATVAINLYLEAKQKLSGEKLQKSRVLGYC